MVSPASGQSNAITGDDARRAFPVHVEAALNYAEDNKYDYGPKYRNMDLEYEIVEARRVAEGIVRVTLEYTPTGKFRGKSGTEYMDVDDNGGVLARRQVRVPKENLPWVLIGVAAISVIAAAILVPVITFVEEAVDPLYVAGRTLYVRSEQPRILPVIYYQQGENTDGEILEWVIVPAGTGTELAMVDITVTNATSGAVNLTIDESAVELTTADNAVYRPINVLTRAGQPVGEIDRRLQVIGFVPMWGSLVLEKGTEVRGKMVFEIPTGSKIKTLRWLASDIATIRYE